MNIELKVIMDNISNLADILTIISITYAAYYGIKEKTKNEIGFTLNQFFTWLMKFGIFLLIFLILYGLSSIFFTYSYVIVKGVLSPVLINDTYKIDLWIAVFIQWSILLKISHYVFIGIFNGILTDSDKFLNFITLGIFHFPEKPQKSLYIKSAKYGANDSFIDVTHILNNMISKNTLLITASNNIAGDPIYDVLKKLIITYKYEEEEEKHFEIQEGKTFLISYENAKEITG